MNIIKHGSLLAIAVLIGTSGALWATGKEEKAGGFMDASCTTSSVAAMTVGHQLSTEIASSSRRAVTRISVPNNATNTAWISIDEGAAATINGGIPLNIANTNGASSTPWVEIGLNTNIPYTGSITAITNFGSSTLLVSSCNY